jgi:hypothetical protein
MSDTPTPTAPAEYIQEHVYHWQLFSGCMRLYIVGPGPDAWFPVSKPDSSKGPPGTLDEQKIAQAAVMILTERYRENKDAGPDEIRQVLEECGWTEDELTIYPKIKI